VRAEAVVVGAGPAGLIAAQEIASRGYDVKVFEEHPEVGVPNHCAGLVSVEGLRRLGVEPSADFVQHEIVGGKVYSPSGVPVEVRCGRTRAYAVERSALDAYLANKAEESGADVITNARAEGLLTSGGRVEGVRGAGFEASSPIVVDGEGAGRRLLRQLTTPCLEEPLMGLNVEMEAEVEPNMVEVWLGGRYAPGLFAWVIPLGDGRARCGLACHGGATERLGAFLKRRFGPVECPPPHGGMVLTGGPLQRTSFDGLLLVGDAAGHTKPTTGGGFVLGGLCAVEAGKVASGALEAGDCSGKFLGRYDKAWRRMYGGEFDAMLSARRLLDRLPDDRIDRLFSSLKGEGLEDTLREIVEKGDMDLQRGALGQALRNPRILGLLMRGVGRLAIAELVALVNV